MEGIHIVHIAAVDPHDVRGETLEVFRGLSGQQVTVYHRKRGAKFAGHFHKGIDSAKDPEYFFMVSGAVMLVARHGKTGETLQDIIRANDFLTVEKGIYHAMEAMTDVIFLEYRSTVFDRAHTDCFPLEEYEAYIRSL